MFGKKKELGPVAFVIGADPEKKLVLFQFGRAVNRLEFTPEDAMEIASNIMTRAAVASGKSVEQLVADRQALIQQSRGPQPPKTTVLK